MKFLSTVLLFLLISISSVYSQNNPYKIFRDSVPSDWIIENPKFAEYDPSFFNKDNAEDYYIAHLQKVGFNKLITWDQNLSLLKFISNRTDDYTLLQGEEADSVYLGSKIKWRDDLSALLAFDQHIYKSKIKFWQLMGKNECVGTINFPSVKFENNYISEITDLNTNTGLAIIPTHKEIDHVKQHKSVLRTTTGNFIKGKGFDLNRDDVIDVFVYDESIGNEYNPDTYKRLYVNINGKWKLAWFALYEPCI